MCVCVCVCVCVFNFSIGVKGENERRRRHRPRPCQLKKDFGWASLTILGMIEGQPAVLVRFHRVHNRDQCRDSAIEIGAINIFRKALYTFSSDI